MDSLKKSSSDLFMQVKHVILIFIILVYLCTDVVEPGPDDIAIIMYTSGSTGEHFKLG